MNALRVLHQFDGLVDTRAGEAHAAHVRSQDGALEAEAYAALDGTGRIAVVELWENERAYGAYWANVVASQAPHLVLDERARRGTESIPAEIVRQQTFHLDGVWIADTEPSEARPAVVWPAGGAVRIVLQLGIDASPPVHDQLLRDQRETRLEPGCTQYEWLRGIDVATHFLLLELWDDQLLYDNHWRLRMKTGPVEPLPMVERARGATGIEFYRHQPFHHLYDRWLPADPHRWSETVVWPA